MELLEMLNSMPGARTWYGRLIMFAMFIVLLFSSVLILYLKFK